jgi:hypothetical protein
MAEMNRARTRLFGRLREAGHAPLDALAIVNAADDCPACAGARQAAKHPGDRGHCFECGRAWFFDRRTAVTARIPIRGAR